MDVLITTGAGTGGGGIGSFCYSPSGTHYDGYLPLVNSITPLSYGLGDNNEYQFSDVKIEFDDTPDEAGNQYFRDTVLQTYKIRGQAIRLKKTNGHKVKYFFILNYSLGLNKFFIHCSDRYYHLEAAVGFPDIKREDFPNGNSDGWGKIIPQGGGTIDIGSAGTIKAYKTGITNFEYIMAPLFFGAAGSLVKVYKPDGTDITGDCTAVDDGSYKQFVKYNLTIEDYLMVNYNFGTRLDTAYEQVFEYVNHIYRYPSGAGFFAEFSVTGLSDFFTSRSTNANSHFCYTENENKNAREFLKEFGVSHNCEFYTGYNFDVQFAWIDYESLTAVATFDNKNIISFNEEIEYDPERSIKNSILTHHRYDNAESKFKRGKRFKKDDSITDWETVDEEINLRFIKNSQVAYQVAKHRALTWKSMGNFWEIVISIDDFWYGSVEDDVIKPGSIIEITHEMPEVDTVRKYQVRGITIDFQNDVVSLLVRDIDFINDYHTACKLLIHSDMPDNCELFFDDSTGGSNLITNNHNTIHDTADHKWGDSCFAPDGANDYLTIPDHDNWDLINQTNFTLERQVKMTDLTADQCFLSQWEDNQNYWYFSFLQANNQLEFKQVQGGVAIITVTSANNALNDIINWHHVALCKKVGNEYGIYVDGVQVAYLNDGSTDTLASDLYIFCFGNGASAFDSSNGDELRITHDNVFSAAPNLALADTITPPTAAYTDEG